MPSGLRGIVRRHTGPAAGPSAVAGRPPRHHPCGPAMRKGDDVPRAQWPRARHPAPLAPVPSRVPGQSPMRTAAEWPRSSRGDRGLLTP